MVPESAFRQHLKSGYAMTLPLAEQARLRPSIRAGERHVFAEAVHRFQARHKFAAEAQAALTFPKESNNAPIDR